MERVRKADHAEQRIDREELPQEDPVRDLAEEFHELVAEHGGQPGPATMLECRRRHDGGGDDRVE